MPNRFFHFSPQWAAGLPGLVSLVAAGALHADIPQAIPHQGRVAVDGMNHDGAGQFKFLLFGDEDADHASGNEVAVWSNASTTPADMNEPASAVSLAVNRGLYGTWLGDTSIANMAVLPAEFDPSDKQLYLRIWFNDGSTGFQQLAPDQKIAPVPYALLAQDAVHATGAGTAQTVEANAIGSVHIANGSVRLADLDLADFDTRYPPWSVQTIVVDAAGGAAFTTIGAAVASVTPTPVNPVVIEVRPGTYTESVTLKSHLHLKGAGMDSSTLIPPTTGATDTVPLKLTDLTNVRISGFTFTEMGGANADAGIHDVRSSPLIHDCRFVDIQAALATVTGGIVSTTSRPVIYRCEFDNEYNGIALYEGCDSLIKACVFGEASVAGHAMVGIRCAASSCRVVGNLFSSHETGVLLENGPAGPARAVVSGNRFTDVAEGVDVNASCFGTITGNHFEADGSFGRGVTNTGIAVISGNTFLNLADSAVDAAGDTTITGNQIDNCGSPSSGNALSITTGAATVSGNTFSNNTGGDLSANAPNVALATFNAIRLEADPGSGLLAGPRLGVGPATFVPTFEFEVRGQSLLGGNTEVNGDLDVIGALDIDDTATFRQAIQTNDITAFGNIVASGGIMSADGYKFNSTETFTYQIPGNTMLPNNDGEDFFRSTQGYINQSGTNTILNIIAPVHLPEGAKVSSLKALFFDNTANNYGLCKVRLRRRPYNTTSEQNFGTLDFTPNGTAANAIKQVTIPVTTSLATIDNDLYQYWIHVELNAPVPDTNLRFFGFRLQYTLTTLQP